MLNLDSDKHLGEKIDCVLSRFDTYPSDDSQYIVSSFETIYYVLSELLLFFLKKKHWDNTLYIQQFFF